MSNVIYDDNTGDLLGYFEDLRQELKEMTAEYIRDNNWEEAKDMCDLLLDLNAFEDNERLLIISDSNGMGSTIKEYRN